MNQNKPSRPISNMAVDNRYNVARGNLLLVFIFTAVNIILGAVQSGTYLLFSASIPYFFLVNCVDIAYHGEEWGLPPVENPAALVVIFTVVAIVLALPYLLCWIFSKKHYGWMIAALVLFSLDTIILVTCFLDISFLLDYLFHAYVLYFLIMGVRNGIKKAHAPTADAAATLATYADVTDTAASTENLPGQSTDRSDSQETSYSDSNSYGDSAFDTPPLRTATLPEKCKSKIYASTAYHQHHITYRLVDQTEELVVDEYVYAEAPHVKKQATQLKATVDSLCIEAGTDASTYYIHVNGRTVAQCRRRL